MDLPFNNRNVTLKHVLANMRAQRSNAFLISPSEAILVNQTTLVNQTILVNQTRYA